MELKSIRGDLPSNIGKMSLFIDPSVTSYEQYIN